jgi:speckle-type POZ protein
VRCSGWVEGNTLMEGKVDEKRVAWGNGKFVSHEDLNNLPILKDGSFEIISRITVKGANAKTDEEVAKEEIIKKEFFTISSDFEKMMNNEETTDFEIVCHGEVLKCHKAVLMSRCDFFNGALGNSMEESKSGKITIDNHKMGIMKEVIHFIYTGKVQQIDQENAEELFKAANQFLLLGLKRICELFLISEVTLSNAIEMMSLGDMYEAGELKKIAKEIIVEAGPAFVEQSDWEERLKQVPNLAFEIIKAVMKK